MRILLRFLRLREIAPPLVNVLYAFCRLCVVFGPLFVLHTLRDWFSSWVQLTQSFSAGKGVSSVDAWYATSIDIEEVLSHARHSDFHIFVADVVRSFDTVDRDILDCALGRLGLPAWFRRVYFSFHRDVRLRFKLAAGLGVAWKRDGSIPQGCPLSMVFIFALYTPWCRYQESQASISPQLYADKLKCTSYSVDVCFSRCSVHCLLCPCCRSRGLSLVSASYSAFPRPLVVV